MTVLENVITSGLFGRVPRVPMRTAEEEAMTATAVIVVRMTGEGMTTGNNSWLKN